MGTSSAIRLVIGIVVIIVGVIWFLQGIGTIGNSSMSGSTFWAIAGVVAVIGGAVLIFRPGRRA
ncbi:MAG: hypothetical protein PSX37_12460 [bacterium]|nr:hypothetical protein [bacterium]